MMVRKKREKEKPRQEEEGKIVNVMEKGRERNGEMMATRKVEADGDGEEEEGKEETEIG